MTGFGAGSSSSGDAVAIQADGKIVVAGWDLTNFKRPDNGGEDFAVARYTTNGTLDRSFGNGGRIVTRVGKSDSEARAVVVQPDGKIVVAGNYASDQGNLALVRYGADGGLDTSFGRGAKVVSNVIYPSGLASARDGKLEPVGCQNPVRVTQNGICRRKAEFDGHSIRRIESVESTSHVVSFV